MKIFIAYLSQTGNTEKIAKVIFDEASQENEVEMSKIEKVDPSKREITIKLIDGLLDLNAD